MKRILFALAVLCSFSCFAAPGGLTSPIISGGGGSGGVGNTNALSPAQNILLTNSAQLPLSQYGVLTNLPSNVVTNHYLPTLLAAQGQFTNILWPDGGLFVHQLQSSGQDEILYQNQNTFWDMKFLYYSDGSIMADLLNDKLLGNGLGVTNTPSSTLSSSNASVTIASSVNPITGETNYDLAASGGGSAFTNGTANRTTQTNINLSGVTTFKAYPGFETPTNGYQLSGRGALPNYPVPYFRPSSLTNSVIALDLMPSGPTPVAQASGIAWFDVCNADLSSNLNGSVSTARVAVFSDHVEFATYSYNGAANLPLTIVQAGVTSMRFNSANLITIGSGNDFQFNPGFGGANEIPASSLFDTASQNLSLLSSGTRFDIDYLDVSSTYRSALTISNGVASGFANLDLMHSGGTASIAGFQIPIIQAGSTNLTLVGATTQGILFLHPMPTTNYVPVVVLNGATVAGAFTSNLTTNGFTQNMTALTFTGKMLWSVTSFTQ